MSFKTGTAALIAFVLAVTSISAVSAPGDRARDRIHRDPEVERDRHSDRNFDRDRIRERERADEPSRDRDRDRTQDRTHAPDFAKLKDDDIYGSELMTRRERNEYRRKLQTADNAEARERIRSEHQHEMQVRAEERGLELKPTAEGPIYGGALLTQQERNEYRARLLEMDSTSDRGHFLAQHREKMQARARAQGVPFEELEE